VFPIRDTVPSRSVPIVTWSLIAVNAAIFLYQLTLPPGTLVAFVSYFGMVPAALLPGGSVEPLPPSFGLPSVVTSMFLHGGLFHIVANMWTLWIFGDNVEDRMGKVRFLVFYLLCGLAAAMTHWLSDPRSTIPTVGASGAIAGVLGAYFMLYPWARVLTLVPIVIWPIFIEVPAFFYLGFWFLTQLASGAVGAGGGGIAWWAHIGGFIAGLALLRAFLQKREVSRPQRHFVLAHPPEPRWPRHRR
jgi:membrane associated rhomboid family serine protease